MEGNNGSTDIITNVLNGARKCIMNAMKVPEMKVTCMNAWERFTCEERSLAAETTPEDSREAHLSQWHQHMIH